MLSKVGNSQQAEEVKGEMQRLSGGKVHNAIEYAIDYIALGEHKKAIDFMELYWLQKI